MLVHECFACPKCGSRDSDVLMPIEGSSKAVQELLTPDERWKNELYCINCNLAYNPKKPTEEDQKEFIKWLCTKITEHSERQDEILKAHPDWNEKYIGMWFNNNYPYFFIDNNTDTITVHHTIIPYEKDFSFVEDAISFIENYVYDEKKKGGE